MTALKRNKLEAQARACDEALQHLLNAVILEGAPADRVLASFFKQNRQYGSRDRRLMRNTIFAVFRWWGWGRLLLPDEFRSLEAPGMITQASSEEEKKAPLSLAAKNAEALFLFSMAMETIPLPSIAEVWAARCSVKVDHVEDCRSEQDLTQRGQQLLNLLGEAIKPLQEINLQMLIPEWAAAHISFPIPSDEAIEWLQRRPPLWIRLQYETPAKLIADLQKDNIQLQFHNQLTQAANAGQPSTNLYGTEAFRRGAFEIQDIASQCVGLACRPQPGERWWDACAGAGGKTLELAALMQGKGTIVATDIRTYKLRDLKKRARRPGVPNITCKAWDGKRPRKKQATFDGVLVDSPCSCSGTWRRNPDARWGTSPADLAELAPLQRRLLRNASGGVKPGGTLVYATCSMLPEENRENVMHFLKENPDFHLDVFDNPLTGEPTDGTLQIWPWHADCDAMFIARFQRQAVQNLSRVGR